LNGKTMAVWTRERWVDVRRQEVRRVMKKRMQWAKQIGCDGVDPGEGWAGGWDAAGIGQQVHLVELPAAGPAAAAGRPYQGFTSQLLSCPPIPRGSQTTSTAMK
jgi:hypothetical protein